MNQNEPGLIVDLFAGGGGASVGIEAASRRNVDIAINHDEIALEVHQANHPKTRHLVADIWEVRPKQAVKGRKVDLLWASPDCTHFSIAKGDVPRSGKIRSLAWAVVRWARETKPTRIALENVPEFQGWGPLAADGRPDKKRKGESFNRFVKQLENLGYAVEWRVLDASQFGAPTKRRRLFLLARNDGQPNAWPAPTHGAGLKPLRTAAECVDWSIACPSIFERKRPLADKTLKRIAAGIRRFVLDSPRPFIVPVNHGGGEERAGSIDAPLPTQTAARRSHAVVAPIIAGCGGRAGQTPATAIDAPVGTITSKNDRVLIAPTLVQTGYGERPGQRPRYLDLHAPLGTMVNGQKHALVSAFLAKHFGGVVGQTIEKPTGTVTARDHHALAAATLVKFRGECNGADVEAPAPTITAKGTHIAEVRAFLLAYYSSGSVGQKLDDPSRTITSKHRLGLVTVAGIDYQIVDIGMRMLEPHELLRAQFGRFAATYDMSAATTKAAKVRLIGNSVCPEVAEALVAANMTADPRGHRRPRVTTPRMTELLRTFDERRERRAEVAA